MIPITKLEFELLLKEYRAIDKGDLVLTDFSISKEVCEGVKTRAKIHGVTQDELVHIYARHYLFYHPRG